MKKVLHVLASNVYSGAENVVCTIISNFSDKYNMAYCSPVGPIEKILQSKKIKYYGIKKLNIGELRKVIKDYNPDIIHAHDYTASVIVACSGFSGKIISHLHNNCPFAMHWNLKTIIYTMTIKKYDKVVGVSDKILDEAVFKKFIKNKFIKIYNYVDRKEIIDKSKEYLYDKKFDLFFIGRLTDQKDPLFFIEIVRKLSNDNKNISAVMIGDGELKNKCIETIDNYKLNKNIKLLGFIENPFPIIKNCKIGVMPSKYEGFGLTAIESLILDKPVLNSGKGGLKEIFIDRKELICTNLEEYIKKINNISNYDNKIDIEKYTNKKLWYNNYSKLYEWRN